MWSFFFNRGNVAQSTRSQEEQDLLYTSCVREEKVESKEDDPLLNRPTSPQMFLDHPKFTNKIDLT